MEYYDNLGFLVFGSRLSEYFIIEINKVYQEKEFSFDASWFPIFFILSKKNELSIVDISKDLQTSHSAVSQLIHNLRKKELVVLVQAKNDGRKQLVTLTKTGEQLLSDIQPIWQEISNTMESLAIENSLVAHLLPAITEIEMIFKEEALSKRITKQLKPK